MKSSGNFPRVTLGKLKDREVATTSRSFLIQLL